MTAGITTGNFRQHRLYQEYINRGGDANGFEYFAEWLTRPVNLPSLVEDYSDLEPVEVAKPPEVKQPGWWWTEPMHSFRALLLFVIFSLAIGVLIGVTIMAG